MFVHSRFVDLDTVEGWPRIVASVRHDPHPVRPTRRRLLQLLAAGAGVGVFGTMPVLAQPVSPTIRPRSAWGGDLPPQGPLEAEAPGDVRFLLVHHTASGNTYDRDDVVGMIRSFHRTHTGPDKGWPDVAYNFFVDLVGHIDDAPLAEALRNLYLRASSIDFLGSWPRVDRLGCEPVTDADADAARLRDAEEWVARAREGK